MSGLKGMTVGELIKELEKLDKDKMVWQCLDNYRGEIKSIRVDDNGGYILEEFDKSNNTSASDCDGMCYRCNIKKECDEEFGQYTIH